MTEHDTTAKTPGQPASEAFAAATQIPIIPISDMWEFAGEAVAERYRARIAELEDQHRSRTGALLDVVRHFTGTWSELITGMPDDYECHMTCAEANAAADLWRAVGDDATAAAIIAAHARHDEDGDEHYRQETP